MGSAAMQPLRSHTLVMQQRVVGILQILGLWDLNTFAKNTELGALWSCGLKRPLESRSQIDFIGVSDGFLGTSSLVNDLDLRSEEALSSTMDHRPVRADIYRNVDAEEANRSRERVRQFKSLPKTRIQNADCAESFRHEMTTSGSLQMELPEYESYLYCVARDHHTRSSQG